MLFAGCIVPPWAEFILNEKTMSQNSPSHTGDVYVKLIPLNSIILSILLNYNVKEIRKKDRVLFQAL